MSIFGGSIALRRRPLRGSRRTHKRRHSMHGGSLMHGGSFPSAYGGSRRRSRSHRGRGIWDTIKNGISSVAPHVLNGLKDIGVSLLKSKLGLGRRRRRAHSVPSMRALPIPRRNHRKMIGHSRFNRSVFSASMIPMIRSAGRRRRHSRRSGGHLIGFSRRRRSVRGSRRTRRRTHGCRRTRRRRMRGSRRRHRRTRGSRRHRRVRRGRGILGNLLGSILPF